MIKFPKEYLDFKDTLECGQLFRFKEYENGYLVFSLDKCAKLYYDGDNAVIDGDESFFEYFDLSRDYSQIITRVKGYGVEKLSAAAERHKGLRILRQNEYEALSSFIVSQNNNIPRIKKTIENLCAALGEKKTFCGTDYYAFPTPEALAKAPLSLYKSLGLGYRDEYIKGTAERIVGGEISFEELKKQPTELLRKSLVSIKGVGNKVADCALLFGFGRTDAFPVDTWIEKLYHEDFGGELTDRKKITAYFTQLFGEDSGYVQQYLFYAKRENEM